MALCQYQRQIASLCLLCAATGWQGVTIANAAQAAKPLPSTFNVTIGHALLCLDVIDPAYFFSYLQQQYGPPYQHVGGAWWFKTPNTKLWQVQLTAIMVSDNDATLQFIAAESEVSTDKLAAAIRTDSGLIFKPGNSGVYPLLVSNTGSIIAWENTKSKIYCAKDRRLFNK